MKPYMFLGSSYYDLNTLGNAFTMHFEQAVEDVYKNTKKLVKFVKKNNKRIVKEVIKILTESRYKNSAVTFLIFTFCKDKRVIINGKQYTFESFVEELKEYPDGFNALYAFMADLGITKTFAKITSEKFLADDSYYIDMNINDPFVYKYLTTYFEFQQVESFHGKIQSVAIANEECFRRASKIMRDETYKLSIAHKFGFKAAYNMHIQINPLFDGIKLISKETDDETLKRLVSDGFFWWMLDNYTKYSFKGEAKYVLRRYNHIKKDVDKYNKMIEKHKIDNITVNMYADWSKELYILYLTFVEYYHDGLITVASAENKDTYALDKPYCKTLIPQAYMQGRIIKLYAPREKKPEVKQEILNHVRERDKEDDVEVNIDIDSEMADFDPNAHTEDLENLIEKEEEEAVTVEEKKVERAKEEKVLDIDDDSDDAPVTLVDKAPMYREKLKNQRKLLRKSKRFAGMTIFFSIVISIINAFFMILTLSADLILKGIDYVCKLMSSSFTMPSKVTYIVKSLETIMLPVGIILIVTTLFGFIFGIVLAVKANKSLKNLDSYIIYDKLILMDKLEPRQVDRLLELRVRKDTLIGIGLKRHSFLQIILCIIDGLMFGVFGLYIVALVNQFFSFCDFTKNSMLIMLLSLSGGVFGLIYGLIKKKKGFISYFLIAIVAILLTFLFAFVF